MMETIIVIVVIVIGALFLYQARVRTFTRRDMRGMCIASAILGYRLTKEGMGLHAVKKEAAMTFDSVFSKIKITNTD